MLQHRLVLEPIIQPGKAHLIRGAMPLGLGQFPQRRPDELEGVGNLPSCLFGLAAPVFEVGNVVFAAL